MAWPAFLVLNLLSVTVVGLLAIWTALGRGHWFVRVAVAGGLLGLLLLVPAYEPLTVFTVQLLVAVPILVLARRLRARKTGQPVWQFGLRDLLLLTLVVAAIAAAGTSVPAKVWQSWDGVKCWSWGIWPSEPAIPPWLYLLILATVAAALTLLAAWIALGRSRRPTRLIVLLVIFPAVVVMFGWVFQSGSLWPHQANPAWAAVGFSEVTPEEVLLLGSTPATALIVVWLALFRASRFGRHAEEVSESPAREQRRRWPWLRWPARAGWVLLSLLVVIPLGWAYWVMMTPLAIPETVLPDPNGYAQLVALGEQLEKVTVPVDDAWLPQSQRPKPQEFIDFERQHHKLLDDARACLDMPCLVPMRYDPSDILDMDVLQTRYLARAMIAAGHAAFLQGNHQKGIQQYVDTIRLGRATARGGMLIHWLVGKALEGMGRQAIHAELAKMPESQRRTLIDMLRQLGEEGESLEKARRRDAIWSQNAYGWMGRLTGYVEELSGENFMPLEACWDVQKRHHAISRILLLEIALEGYRDKHQTYPKRLENLVPEELDTLPLDPFSDKPLRYKLTDKGYLLYSVGPNTRDDGGVILDSNNADDVRFE